VRVCAPAAIQQGPAVLLGHDPHQATTLEFRPSEVGGAGPRAVLRALPPHLRRAALIVVAGRR
jgi:hypothetical protein